MNNKVIGVVLWVGIIGLLVLWILDRLSLMNKDKIIIQQSAIIGDQENQINDLKKKLPTTPPTTEPVPTTPVTAP
jgi:hypothetical protein